MKLTEFEVNGLFELYNHKLDFSKSKNQKSDDGASVVMIYGKNGIGKTTVLRMIEGLMTLNFDVFRTTKFISSCLKFSNNTKITVASFYKEKKLEYLLVTYKDLEIKLHPKQKGPLLEDENETKESFLKQYTADLENFSFEFIDTERLIKKTLKEEMLIEEKTRKGRILRKQEREASTYLIDKVKSFIRDSQIYYSQYFQRTEPELFDRILNNLEQNTNIKSKDLLERVSKISSIEKEYQVDRLGLAKEKWNRKKLVEIINASNKNKNKLTIISSYIEVLESRNEELKNLADRLLKFEQILNDFLLDKSISINQNGFTIKAKNGDILEENLLSTGEYHLLYLTVLALCTKVKGTVIAIDEPEMSMHLSWQNNLVNALIQISSKASPQLIFATHSPDIAKNYTNSLNTIDYGQN